MDKACRFNIFRQRITISIPIYANIFLMQITRYQFIFFDIGRIVEYIENNKIEMEKRKMK